MVAVQQSRRLAPALLWRGSVVDFCAEGLALACCVFFIEESINYVGFFSDQGQAIWWPTNGLVLALMLRLDRSHWFTILIGAMLGSWVGGVRHGWPVVSHIINAIANSLGPLIAALLLPQFKRLEEWLQEPHLVFRYAIFALVLAPVLSATIFATNVHLFLPGLDFWTVLQTRADSDMLGYALFTPLVLVLSSKETYRRLNLAEISTLALLLGLMIGTTYIVFWQRSYPLCFVLISVVLVVTLRLGFIPSVIAVNLLAILATVATMHGHGPLTFGAGVMMANRILLLQGFLASTMLTVFSVSVMQVERRVFQQRLQLAYEEMEKRATTDALTGVANRRLFEESLKLEWARALRTGDSIALLMLDVDHFKFYNDRFGHPAGDACLRRIAQAIVALEHRSTDLLARYGGEEFAYLLPGARQQDAARIAEAIRARIERIHLDPDQTCDHPVSISIGCAAVTPAIGIVPQLLIGASDEALYQAKRNGRNRVEVAEAPSMSFDLERLMAKQESRTQ
jgi:diguanylate cyclase (GGDEF)-like protein